ncbi:hypothetical protein [Flexivirga oryzae]|uniref:Flagellar basal body-associated protein FliL n=1 Tax=Flexivirga oryzae TaxID=1794944 RepID=A0A839N8P4_9MICO|nr:hypothetical protein [Flexivirga oryzae]MBB2893169.1 flagellar basal body-associated protein FliL [Flexivirga oryzae]
MTGILIAVVVLVLLAVVCGVTSWRAHQARLYGPPRTAAEVHARLEQADEEVTAAWKATRRAMNDAVGQSWRNFTD